MVELEKSRGNDIWRTGQLQQYDLSVSGGMDLVRYFLSGYYENTQGVEPDNSVDKWGMRANVTVTPNDKLDIRGNLGYVSGRTNLSYEAGGGGFTWTTYFARLDRLDGPRRGFYSGTPESYTGTFDQRQGLDRTTAGVTINHRPFARFSHRFTVGFDHTREQDNDIQYHDEKWLDFWSFSDRGYRSTQERNVDYTTVDYAATYQWPVSQELESSTSVGGQFYRGYSELVSAYGEVWPTPGLTSISATTQNRSASQTSVENTTVGMYVQEQLSWQNRLFLTAALRGDDNSAFGVDYDFVTYPKVSAAWVVTEEPFWDYDFANTLKLRGAYGESGQQPDAFVAIRTFSPVAGPNNVGTVTPDNLGNPDLGPERGTEIELGFDAIGTAINLLCDDGHGGSTACDGAPNVYMGRTVPSTEGGFASTLTLFNNIRLFAQLDFKTGFTKLDGNYRVRCYFFSECRENWYPTEFDPAKIAEIQAAGTYAGALLDDADFLKLREVSVSYGVPSEWVSRVGAQRGNITVAARNLYTWTKFMGLEPESTFNGGSRGGSFSLWEQNVLPQLAQLVVTFNVNF